MLLPSVYLHPRHVAQLAASDILRDDRCCHRHNRKNDLLAIPMGIALIPILAACSSPAILSSGEGAAMHAGGLVRGKLLG